MTKKIIIGGDLRPLKFGFGALYQYEVRTGRSAIEDFNLMQKGFKVSILVELLYSGLLCGAKEEGKPFDYTGEEVAGWLDENPEGLLSEITQLFVDSMPQDKGDKGKGKTKAAVTN